MTLKVGAIELRSGLFVAPMAGITDRPFRRLARRFGAALAVSEMLSSQNGHFLIFISLPSESASSLGIVPLRQPPDRTITRVARGHLASDLKTI